MIPGAMTATWKKAFNDHNANACFFTLFCKHTVRLVCDATVEALYVCKSHDYTGACSLKCLRMKFNHLIEINNPLNPLITPLTREQLWRGLVLRAEMPTMFVPWLDRCDVLTRAATTLSRELHYGTLVVRDHVTFVPQQSVHYAVPAQQDIAASSLVMTIEEPEPGIFFVRFEYDDGSDDSSRNEEDAMVSEIRRSAYEESDIDTIRVIRQLAEQGRFTTPPSQ